VIRARKFEFGRKKLTKQVQAIIISVLARTETVISLSDNYRSSEERKTVKFQRSLLHDINFIEEQKN